MAETSAGRTALLRLLLVLLPVVFGGGAVVGGAEARRPADEWRRLRRTLTETVARSASAGAEAGKPLRRAGILLADLRGPLPEEVRRACLRAAEKHGGGAGGFDEALKLLYELDFILRYGEVLKRAEVRDLAEFFAAEELFNAYLDGPEKGAEERLAAAARVRGLSAQAVEALVRYGRRRPALFKSDKEAERPCGLYVFHAPRRDELEMPLKYRVLLPADYHPARPKPLAILLHRRGEQAEDELKFWADEILRRGWSAAAPECFIGRKAGYGALPEERRLVLRTVADCRRRLAVDEERVYLLGRGLGAYNVWDTALTFPGRFAAAVAVNGAPCATAFSYLPLNLRAAPFYCLLTRPGSRAAKTVYGVEKQLRTAVADFRFEKSFAPRKEAQTPPAKNTAEADGKTDGPSKNEKTARMHRLKTRLLNWCAGRCRPRAPRLVEFVTADLETSRCAWLETLERAPAAVGEVKPHHGPPRRKLFDTAVRPQGRALVRARAAGDNELVLYVRKLPGVRVYLCRKLFDLSRPVTVRLNHAPPRRLRVKSSLRFLLATARRLGDRDRLYWAALELPVPKQDQ